MYSASGSRPATEFWFRRILMRCSRVDSKVCTILIRCSSLKAKRRATHTVLCSTCLLFTVPRPTRVSPSASPPCLAAVHTGPSRSRLDESLSGAIWLSRTRHASVVHRAFRRLSQRHACLGGDIQ